MAASDLRAALSGTTCEVQVLPPSTTRELETLMPRWSSVGVETPYAIVVPSIVSDITSVIAYATTHTLKVIPTGGCNCPALPINSRTIYLPLSNFKKMELDESTGLVDIDGAVISGDLMSYLGEKGWYTCVPNSNSIGMVGALLGGLQHLLLGKHGLGIDNIEEVRIVPFSMPNDSKPRELVVKKNTPDDAESRLFNVLCGAGIGFGVITGMKLRAWPLKHLNMTNDQVWTRTIIWPGNAVEAAHSALQSLISPPPILRPAMIVARAPPTTPTPGAPIILLAISYFGPAAEAERIVDELLPKDALAKAVNVITVATEFAKINNQHAHLGIRGGYKEFLSSSLKELDEAGLRKAVESHVRFTNANMASRAVSNIVISPWNPQITSRVEESHPKTLSTIHKGRIFVQVSPWYSSIEEREAALAFCREATKALRSTDVREGQKPAGFLSNILLGQDLRDVFTDKQIAELRAVKAVWDRDSVGWNAAVDGW